MIGETFDLIEKYLIKHTKFLSELIANPDGWTVWNEILLNKIKIKQVWIRRESGEYPVEESEGLAKALTDKGIKNQLLSDEEWDEELGYIFQDMEVKRRD